MSLTNNFLGPKSFSRHLTKRKSGRSSLPTLGLSLTLTPFIDCFSILVIFLLNQMSTDAEALKHAQAIELPSAVSGVSLTQSISITLGPEGITVGDKPIPQEALEAELRKTRGRQAAGSVKIVLQADRTFSSSKVVGMIQRLSALGYGTVQLAVTPGGRLAQKEAK